MIETAKNNMLAGSITAGSIVAYDFIETMAPYLDAETMQKVREARKLVDAKEAANMEARKAVYREFADAYKRAQETFTGDDLLAEYSRIQSEINARIAVVDADFQ